MLDAGLLVIAFEAGDTIDGCDLSDEVVNRSN